jgi:hypothetical protein
MKKTLFTWKGLAVACVILLWFSPLLFSFTYAGQGSDPSQVLMSRRVAPFALFLLWLLGLFGRTGEPAIPFTPAEVNFLFTGPFSRRQLLGYKVASAFVSSALAALFFLLFLRKYSGSILLGYVSLVLMMMFLQLSTMVFALVFSVVGAAAYTRWRRRGLIVLLALVVLLLVRMAPERPFDNPMELLERAENSSLVRVITAPFRWHTEVMTADRLWPDFMSSLAKAISIDLALLAIIFLLDAQYLEMSARAGERLYTAFQKARRGGQLVWQARSGSERYSLPDFPPWGGVGSLAWRQLVAAKRSQGVLVMMVAMLAVVGIPLLAHAVSGSNGDGASAILPPLFAMLLLFLPAMLTFDFRGDLDRMDFLKTLPLGGVRIALGQLAAPVIVSCLIQWGALAVLGALAPEPSGPDRGATSFSLATLFLVAAVFAPPVNFLLFGIENLVFLWYPVRSATAAGGDFQIMGRNMLIMFLKFVALGIAGGCTGTAAALVYALVAWLNGPALFLSLVTAWVMLAGFVAAIVPLVAAAFRNFDVALDTPP